MSTTTTQPEATTKVKLSCNHVVYLDGTPAAGDLVGCDRCTARNTGHGMATRRRRIRQVLNTEPTAANERDAASQRVDDLTESLGFSIGLPHLVASIQGLFAELAGSNFYRAAVEIRQQEDVPTEVADVATYDVQAADNEWKAVKAWREAGRVGDAPSTKNLDALNAAHAAGAPRSGRKAAGKKATTGKGRTTHARRAEANAIKAQGKRGPGRKVTDAELAEYISKVKAAGHGTTGNDELEYAYWVEGLALTRVRWNAAWAD